MSTPRPGPSEPAHARPSTPPPAGGATAALAELREILLGAERRELESLRRRLEEAERAKDIARVLPEGLVQAARADSRLIEALAPLVEEALATAARRKPERIARALEPSLRALAPAALGGLGRRLLERASPLVGRYRSGVEEVLLLERPSGRLLGRVRGSGSSLKGRAELLAAMEVVARLVRDAGREAHGIESLPLGPRALLVEWSPSLAVVAVARGKAPAGLREGLRRAAQALELRHREEVGSWPDERAPREALAVLKDCLLPGEGVVRGRPSPWLFLIALGLAALLALGAQRLADARRWARYLATLSRSDGIVVTGAERGLWSKRVEGLRDPQAKDPLALAVEAGFERGRVQARFAPYLSLAPRLIEARAKALLEPPSGVELRYDEGGVLRAVGRAPGAWIEASGQRALRVAGVSAFDAERLIDSDLEALAELKARAEALELSFPPGRREPLADELKAAARAMSALLRASFRAHEWPKVTVLGRGDGKASGADWLGRERARAVAEGLSRAGVDAKVLGASAASEGEPGTVRFRIVHEDLPRPR